MFFYDSLIFLSGGSDGETNNSIGTKFVLLNNGNNERVSILKGLKAISYDYGKTVESIAIADAPTQPLKLFFCALNSSMMALVDVSLEALVAFLIHVKNHVRLHVEAVPTSLDHFLIA